MPHYIPPRYLPVLKALPALFASICALLATSGCGDRSSGSGPHISVQLVADQDSVAPGSAFTLGVKFVPEPGWHIYWKNPGDSGLPPRFEWQAGPEVNIKQPLWPYPERIALGPLVNYGYGDVLIPFPATLSASAKPGSAAPITLSVKWLVCKDECLPGEAVLERPLPVSKQAGEPSKYSGLFADTFASIPAPLSRVSIAVEEQEQSIKVAVIPIGERFLPPEITFFPEDPRIIANAAPQQIERSGNILSITLKRDPLQKNPITRIRGVLYSPQGWSERGVPKAVSIDTRADDQASGDAGLPPAHPNSTTSAPAEGQPGFVYALLLAFLGGALLNLMPCVFPVLSIKILSFVEHSKEEPRTVRLHGIAFCAGVLVSFWALAGLLLALRAGGQQLGWGFQLQSPTFVVLMAITFFILGLLFLGDLSLGQRIQGAAGSAKVGANLRGSFLNGVLATAVATPCTGPFMGSAIAATLTLPALLSLLIFSSLGLGMSAPYLLLSFQPRLLRLLPRPGAWMAAFKELMAFPLFASAVWLVRVFARQMGMDPSGLNPLMDVLWGLLIAAFAFWAAAKAQGAARRESRIGLHLLAAFCLAWSALTALPNRAEIDASRNRACSTDGSAAPAPDEHGLLWEPYSAARVAELVAGGRTVYIDFTAEWCITCQVNEARVFGSDEVRQLLRAKNVALVKADWTSTNPAITEGLQRFGRNGVPLNVIVARDREPEILPNVLSPGIVIEALKRF